MLEHQFHILSIICSRYECLNVCTILNRQLQVVELTRYPSLLPLRVFGLYTTLFTNYVREKSENQTNQA